MKLNITKKINSLGFDHVFLAISFVVLIGVIGSAYIVLNHATPWSGYLKLALNQNYCMNNYGKSGDIYLYLCNEAQRDDQSVFTINDLSNGNFTLVDSSNKCISDTDGVGISGSREYVNDANCVSGDMQQEWHWWGSGGYHEIRNASTDGCINDPANEETTYPLIMYSCAQNSSNEWWYEATAPAAGSVGGGNPTVTETGELSSGLTNSSGSAMCLDDENDSTANTAPIVIDPCSTTSAAQKWSLYSNNTIRINGKCLDVQSQGTANGSHIDLYTCNSGTNQTWTPGTDGSLVSKQSGKCLDVYTSATANNSEVDLWGCDQTSAQLWGWNTGSTIVPGGSNNQCLKEGGNVSSGGCYFWGQGTQGNMLASGAEVTMSAVAPKVSSQDLHSDNEMLVSNNGNSVEVCSIVGPNSSTPHLLIDYWKGGAVYDNDFVAVAGAPITNGAVMQTTGTFTITIQYLNSQWQVLYNNKEVGYYPESTFGSGTPFTQLNYADVYGEVEGQIGEQTTSQMGNGLLGSNPNSAYFTNYQLIGANAPADLSVAGPSGAAAQVYNVGEATTTGFHYGGPGF